MNNINNSLIVPNKSLIDVKIPKIIMQTWKDNNVPEKWKSSVESVKKYMSDWNYVLMTDKDNRNFVSTYFPDFLKYYDNLEYNIQRADAIRYMWLYVNGGIYMDLDFEILKPLDIEFVPDADLYLISSGNIGSYVTNSFMASKPRINLWLRVIEQMKKPLPSYYFGKHFRVMLSTGPMMLTNVLAEYDGSYIKLPKSKFSPCSVCNINCLSNNTYLKSLEGSSWIGYDTRIYNFFMCNWKNVLYFIFVIIIIIILYFVYRYVNKYFI